MTFLQINTFSDTNFLFRVIKAFQSLTTAYRKWALYRRTVSELKSLNTRELSDLGISRSMITTIANDSVYNSK